jgi:RNA polymerase sigma factor (sigma-70 family)
VDVRSYEDRLSLFEKYQNFARNVAQRASIGLPPQVDRKEVEQLALIGLWDVTKRLHEDLGTRKTHAYIERRCRGEIKDHCRERDFLSRTYRTKMRRMVEESDRQAQKEMARQEEVPQISHVTLEYLRGTHEEPYEEGNPLRQYEATEVRSGLY